MIGTAKPIWYVMLGLCFFIMLCFLVGCESASAKLSQAMRDDIAAIHKVVVDTDNKVEGNANVIKTINDNSQMTITAIQKTQEEINQQIQKGAGVSSDKIDRLEQKVVNTSNSSWLVFGIVALLVALLAVCIVLLSTRAKIKRVINSPLNPLTAEDFKNA